MLTASTASIGLMIGSMIIALLMLHYLARVGRRLDPLCALALLSTTMGLSQSARAAEASSQLWVVTIFGFLLFAFGVLAWLMGLRRFRDAG